MNKNYKKICNQQVKTSSYNQAQEATDLKIPRNNQ